MSTSHLANLPQHDDPVWRKAWDWVIREHESALDAAARAELAAWRQADPAHARCHDEASQIWLLAALVPDNTAD